MAKQTHSERMKAAWARRRAAAPNGKVSIKRRAKAKKPERVSRVIDKRSPLKLALDTAEKIEALLDELPNDLRAVVINHLN